MTQFHILVSKDKQFLPYFLQMGVILIILGRAGCWGQNSRKAAESSEQLQRSSNKSYCFPHLDIWQEVFG